MSNLLFNIDYVYMEKAYREYRNNKEKVSVGFSCRTRENLTQYYQFIDEDKNYEMIGTRLNDVYRNKENKAVAKLDVISDTEYHITRLSDNAVFKILMKESFAMDYIEYIDDKKKTIMDIIKKPKVPNAIPIKEGLFVEKPAWVNRFYLPFDF